MKHLHVQLTTSFCHGRRSSKVILTRLANAAILSAGCAVIPELNADTAIDRVMLLNAGLKKEALE